MRLTVKRPSTKGLPSLLEVGWSPLRNHPINVRGGQVSDWEESEVLAALAVSELSAALQ